MTKIKNTVLFFFLFFLPFQVGEHFFFDFSYVNGVRVDYLSPTLYLTDILFFCLALLYWKVIFQHIRTYKVGLLFLCVLFFVNIAQAQAPLLALYTLLKLLEVYVCFLIFRSIKKDVRLFFIPLLIGVTFELTLALFQFKNGASMQGLFYYTGERFFSLSTPGIAKASLAGRELLRPYATFSHPNSMAGFYLLIFSATIYIQNGLNRFHAFIKYSLMLLCSLLILISFSKTAIATLILINLIYQLRKPQKCLLCLFSQIIIMIVLGFIYTHVQSDPFSLDKRLLLLSESFEIIQMSPLLGTGLGNNLYHHSLFPSNLPYFHLQPVHNIFILFFMQTGIIISAIVGVRLFRLLRWRWKKIAYPLFVIIITGFFDHYWLTLQQNMLLFGVIFGFLLNTKNRG